MLHNFSKMAQNMLFHKLSKNMYLLHTTPIHVMEMYTIGKYKHGQYLRFDYDMNFYIPTGTDTISILDLISELRELVAYLDKNGIKWSGSRNNVTMSTGNVTHDAGILVVTSDNIIIISSDESGNVQKAEFPLR